MLKVHHIRYTLFNLGVENNSDVKYISSAKTPRITTPGFQNYLYFPVCCFSLDGIRIND